MSSEDRQDEKVSEELDRLEEENQRVPEQRRTLGRGPEVLREQLQQAAQRKTQLTMRLDADIIERFKALSGLEGSYQTLMNRALHEWLEAQSVERLLQPKLELLSQLITRIERQEQLREERDAVEGDHPSAS